MDRGTHDGAKSVLQVPSLHFTAGVASHSSILSDTAASEVKSEKTRLVSVNELLQFYSSIPDYGEVNHLSDAEFYERLQHLKEKRSTYNSTTIPSINLQLTNTKTNYDCRVLCNMNTDIKPSDKKSENYDKNYKLYSPLSDRQNTFVINNRGSLVEDSECKNGGCIPSPENMSLLSCDTALALESSRKGKDRTNTSKYKPSVGKSPSFTGIDSSSSVEESVRSNADCYNKFDFRSDSDSAPPCALRWPRNAERMKKDKDETKAENSTFERPVRKQKLEPSYGAENKLWAKESSSDKQENSTSIMYHSAPDLRASSGTLKASPVPRNLFSTCTNQKINPEEYCRSLQRRIRAEELLNLSSLSPSMAARAKSALCLRGGGSSKDLGSDNVSNEALGKDFELHCSSASSSGANCVKTHSRKFLRKGKDRMDTSSSNCVTSASPSDCLSAPYIPLRPLSVSIPSRNNLAAILRIQSTRQKLERDLQAKLEELKRKEDACIKAHLARQQPAWQVLNYSTEEDLAMRLRLRNEKERRHRKEHQLQMDLMLARVRQIPPLFERQTGGPASLRTHGECRNDQ